MNINVKAKKQEEKQYNKTRIVFIMDKSGSMNVIKTDTEGGFKAFVEDQAKEDGEATLTLVEFNDKVNVTYTDVNINEVPDYKLYPGGWTALYDAIGLTIEELIANNDPEVKTIIAILTDGEENSSKQFSQEAVKSMIEKVQSDLDWDVMFIGANIDAKKYAKNLGIGASNATSFSYDGQGAVAAMKTMSLGTSVMRGITKNYADGTLMSKGTLNLDQVYADNSN